MIFTASLAMQKVTNQQKRVKKMWKYIYVNVTETNEVNKKKNSAKTHKIL